MPSPRGRTRLQRSHPSPRLCGGGGRPGPCQRARRRPGPCQRAPARGPGGDQSKGIAHSLSDVAGSVQPGTLCGSSTASTTSSCNPSTPTFYTTPVTTSSTSTPPTSTPSTPRAWQAASHTAG
ncbi:unnamed protein product [Arctogadus glacialis]